MAVPATLDDLLAKLTQIDNHLVGLRSDFNAFFTNNLYWYALAVQLHTDSLAVQSKIDLLSLQLQQESAQSRDLQKTNGKGRFI